MKLPVAILAVIASISATVDATVYFKEQFLDGGAVNSTIRGFLSCVCGRVVKVTLAGP